MKSSLYRVVSMMLCFVMLSINKAHDLIDIAVGDCLLGLRSDGVVVGIDFSCIGGAFDLTKQGSASFK